MHHALILAHKTIALSPFIRVVVIGVEVMKARTQIALLPDLAFHHANTGPVSSPGEDQRQSLVKGCMCLMLTMVLNVTMLL